MLLTGLTWTAYAQSPTSKTDEYVRKLEIENGLLRVAYKLDTAARNLVTNRYRIALDSANRDRMNLTNRYNDLVTQSNAQLDTIDVRDGQLTDCRTVASSQTTRADSLDQKLRVYQPKTAFGRVRKKATNVFTVVGGGVVIYELTRLVLFFIPK